MMWYWTIWWFFSLYSTWKEETVENLTDNINVRFFYIFTSYNNNNNNTLYFFFFYFLDTLSTRNFGIW